MLERDGKSLSLAGSARSSEVARRAATRLFLYGKATILSAWATPSARASCANMALHTQRLRDECTGENTASVDNDRSRNNFLSHHWSGTHRPHVKLAPIDAGYRSWQCLDRFDLRKQLSLSLCHWQCLNAGHQFLLDCWSHSRCRRRSSSNNG